MTPRTMANRPAAPIVQMGLPAAGRDNYKKETMTITKKAKRVTVKKTEMVCYTYSYKCPSCKAECSISPELVNFAMRFKCLRCKQELILSDIVPAAAGGNKS